MSTQGYLTDSMKTEYDSALYTLFETYMSPFTVYVTAQQAVISTSFTYSRFGDHSQNAAITPDNTVVNPLSYVVSGCINYGNGQPWEYVEPGSRGNYQQDKIRESFGTVKLKVTPTGYALLKDAKSVVLDGFNFTLTSNARPHGLVGSPNRYTFVLQKVD